MCLGCTWIAHHGPSGQDEEVFSWEEDGEAPVCEDDVGKEISFDILEASG